MRIETETTFSLLIESRDDMAIFHALRKKGLTEAYEQFRDNRDLIFENDPDAGSTSRIDISKLSELAAVLPIVAGVAERVSLHIEGGDRRAGFRVTLGEGMEYRETSSEWTGDPSIFSDSFSAVEKAARELLSQLRSL